MAKSTDHHEDRKIGEFVQSQIEFDIDWSGLLSFIQRNFDPEEIYTDGELGSWASDNDYYTKDDIFQKFDPEEIYDRDTLQECAVRLGFVGQ